MNQRSTLLAGAIFGFLGVCLGAFGAHALKPLLLQTGRLDTYELAVRYQFFHAFALLAAGALMQFNFSLRLKYGALCFVLGVLFFSGSLYVLAFTGWGVLGAVTPIGGLFLIFGWSFMGLGILKKK
ncbi:MAG TPA: DUF423 domain-containing protein [Ohtaekwangia sp.]|nr:DUF423 domain-containing protein [Ohtaekwangia sp.]